MNTSCKSPHFLLLLAMVAFLHFQTTETYGAKYKAGDKAPDFTLSDPTGKSVSLSSLQGRIVLLDFWASWCGYCKIANEEFVPIYNTYKAHGFEIFSVSLDSKKEAWVNGIKNQQLPWSNHVSDLKGWESKVAELYGVDELPTTFLIDEEGTILEVNLDEIKLEKKLNWIYNQQVQFYPQTASTKLFFTGKAKYEVKDSKGLIVLKGKDIAADISQLPAGEYEIIFENKTEKFVKKEFESKSPVTVTSDVANQITLSREAEYELYTERGKRIKKGTGQVIAIGDIPGGAYLLSLEGNVQKIEKK